MDLTLGSTYGGGVGYRICVGFAYACCDDGDTARRSRRWRPLAITTLGLEPARDDNVPLRAPGDGPYNPVIYGGSGVREDARAKARAKARAAKRYREQKRERLSQWKLPDPVVGSNECRPWHLLARRRGGPPVYVLVSEQSGTKILDVVSSSIGFFTYSTDSGDPITLLTSDVVWCSPDPPDVAAIASAAPWGW